MGATTAGMFLGSADWVDFFGGGSWRSDDWLR